MCERYIEKGLFVSGPSWIWRSSTIGSIGMRYEMRCVVCSRREFVDSGPEYLCWQESMCQSREGLDSLDRVALSPPDCCQLAVESVAGSDDTALMADEKLYRLLSEFDRVSRVGRCELL